MDTLKYIISSLTTIGGGVIGWAVATQKTRRLKKVSNIIDSKDILDQCSEEFKKEFVIPDFEENYFFLQTGINTNKNSIPKYIQLKNTLGKNFVWKDIKDARPYLNLEDGNIEINISRLDKIRRNTIIILTVFMFIIFITISMYTVSLLKEGDYLIFLLPAVIMFLGMLLVQALVNSIKSVNATILIEKRLKKIAKSDAQ